MVNNRKSIGETMGRAEGPEHAINGTPTPTHPQGGGCRGLPDNRRPVALTAHST